MNYNTILKIKYHPYFTREELKNNYLQVLSEYKEIYANNEDVLLEKVIQLRSAYKEAVVYFEKHNLFYTPGLEDGHIRQRREELLICEKLEADYYKQLEEARTTCDKTSPAYVEILKFINKLVDDIVNAAKEARNNDVLSHYLIDFSIFSNKKMKTAINDLATMYVSGNTITRLSNNSILELMALYFDCIGRLIYINDNNSINKLYDIMFWGKAFYFLGQKDPAKTLSFNDLFKLFSTDIYKTSSKEDILKLAHILYYRNNQHTWRNADKLVEMIRLKNYEEVLGIIGMDVLANLEQSKLDILYFFVINNKVHIFKVLLDLDSEFINKIKLSLFSQLFELNYFDYYSAKDLTSIPEDRLKRFSNALKSNFSEAKYLFSINPDIEFVSSIILYGREYIDWRADRKIECLKRILEINPNFNLNYDMSILLHPYIVHSFGVDFIANITESTYNELIKRSHISENGVISTNNIFNSLKLKYFPPKEVKNLPPTSTHKPKEDMDLITLEELITNYSIGEIDTDHIHTFGNDLISYYLLYQSKVNSTLCNCEIDNSFTQIKKLIDMQCGKEKNIDINKHLTFINDCSAFYQNLTNELNQTISFINNGYLPKLEVIMNIINAFNNEDADRKYVTLVTHYSIVAQYTKLLQLHINNLQLYMDSANNLLASIVPLQNIQSLLAKYKKGKSNGKIVDFLNQVYDYICSCLFKREDALSSISKISENLFNQDLPNDVTEVFTTSSDTINALLPEGKTRVLKNTTAILLLPSKS